MSQLEDFSWSEFRFLTWGIPSDEWNRSAFSFRSVPIVHEAEIDSVNRAVEPIGLQIGRLTPVEKKDKYNVAVLNLQWTDDLKSAFIHKRCIKRNFVPDSGRSVEPNLTPPPFFLFHLSIYLLNINLSMLHLNIYNSKHDLYNNH